MTLSSVGYGTHMGGPGSSSPCFNDIFTNSFNRRERGSHTSDYPMFQWLEHLPESLEIPVQIVSHHQAEERIEPGFSTSQESTVTIGLKVTRWVPPPPTRFSKGPCHKLAFSQHTKEPLPHSASLSRQLYFPNLSQNETVPQPTLGYSFQRIFPFSFQSLLLQGLWQDSSTLF